MAEITVLDSSTIDKIAAGEVVERPSSVVKELVENAIDSGADAITVEIKEGGISFIRVTDNGSGIEKSQIRKAFLRHATSKIKTVEDLLSVSSLGFRGEALSSIAAVAQVELISKTEADLTGIRYTIEGGVEKDMEEIGAPCGTTMIVRNLFFHTPARRKFLKTVQTEGGYISDLMEHMAMSKPHIAFQYIQNGQVKFHTSGSGDLKEIIYRIYGRDTAAELLTVSAHMEGITIEGYIGKPVMNRANRLFENYFVNGRYIKSDLINKAIEEGYKGYLMQHKYPFTALHFTIAPEYLDVNVHPNKMDIRFTNQNIFFDFIIRTVSEALAVKELIPEVTPDTAAETREQKSETQHMVEKPEKAPEPFETMRKAESVQEQKVAETAEYTVSDAKMQDVLQNPIWNKVVGSFDKASEPAKDSIHANVIKSKDHIIVEKPVQLDLFEEKLLTKEARDDYKILGQIFDTYWLVNVRDRLFIIDQHAAHEKVKYERLLKQITERTLTTQMLNPPIILNFSAREEVVYQQYEEHFHALGFETEEFGSGSYAIRSVPAELFGCQEKQLFMEILDELIEKPLKGVPSVMEEKLASMACKAAVKGNHTMSRAEAEHLIDELLSLDNPYNCPHGRPTIISMSKYEIEKKFKRIV